MHTAVISNVIAIITQGRRIERQQPEGGHPEILQIVQLLDKSLKIANAVAITIVEGSYVEFINDRIFVPQRIVMGLRKPVGVHGRVYSLWVINVCLLTTRLLAKHKYNISKPVPW